MKLTLQLEKELKLDRIRCAFIKTICVFVYFACLLCVASLVLNGVMWLLKNVRGEILFLIACALILSMLFLLVFSIAYDSCKTSNQKKTATNVNQTTKKTTPIQSKTEPVTYSTHSQQNTTSEQFDIKPTKQYPVLGEIQKIISHLSELEKNQDLDKDLFVEFHVLKDKFNSDQQEIVKMLNKLEEINQFDDNYLEPFNHYLDLFKKQQQIIYDNIKQQYNDKLNTINEQLQHFN